MSPRMQWIVGGLAVVCLVLIAWAVMLESKHYDLGKSVGRNERLIAILQDKVKMLQLYPPRRQECAEKCSLCDDIPNYWTGARDTKLFVYPQNGDAYWVDIVRGEVIWHIIPNELIVAGQEPTPEPLRRETDCAVSIFPSGNGFSVIADAHLMADIEFREFCLHPYYMFDHRQMQCGLDTRYNIDAVSAHLAVKYGCKVGEK